MEPIAGSLYAGIPRVPDLSAQKSQLEPHSCRSSLGYTRLPCQCECGPGANPLISMLVISVPFSLVGDPSVEATCRPGICTDAEKLPIAFEHLDISLHLLLQDPVTLYSNYPIPCFLLQMRYFFFLLHLDRNDIRDRPATQSTRDAFPVGHPSRCAGWERSILPC